ncbi:MAG: CvpA family protein [Thiohalomonadales bacterium]
MVWVDYLIPAIIGLSALFSLMRGFVREAISLLGWLASFWVSLRYSHTLADLFLSGVTTPSLRIIIAFAILFIFTLMLSALINHLASYLVQQTGLTGTDRAIGIIFGVIRGGIIVSILVVLAGMTEIPQDPWWQKSILIEHFQNFALWLQDNVAAEVVAIF